MARSSLQDTAAHRQELQQLISEARSRQGMVAFTGYVGGYCANSDCDVRQVLIRIKGYLDSIQEVHCPSCRSLLLLGDHEWSVTVATGQEFSTLLKKRAIQAVWRLLRDERGQCLFTVSDLCREYTLDDLDQAFRKREIRREAQ
jgi:hypothetical protein